MDAQRTVMVILTYINQPAAHLRTGTIAFTKDIWSDHISGRRTTE